MVKQDVSPIDLIEELGVETRTLGKWLVGEASPRPGHLHALAKALGVDKEALLEDITEAQA